MKISLGRTILSLVVAAVLVKRSSFAYAQQYDPCTTQNQIGDSRRTTTEDPGTCGGICDNYIVTGNWYRIDVSNSGAQMPESCVPIWHCGTYIPIWLNAAHPTASSPGPVYLPVCAQLSNTGDCCEWRSTIQVKYCQVGAVDYFVYQLVRPPYCDMAYCAGSGVNCGISGSWNDILQNCTSTPYPSIGADPTLMGPYISSSVQVTDTNGKPFTATAFSFKCYLTYTQRTTDDGSRYGVDFVAGSSVVYSTILKSTDKPEVVMTESYLAGHIDQYVFCRVTSYWQSQYPKRSAYKQSLSLLIGFVYINAATNIQITGPLSIIEGEKIKVNVVPTFPITTPACVASPTSPCSPSYSLRVSSQQLRLSNCTISVSNGSTASFVLSPIANVDTTLRSGYFSLIADNTLQAQGSIFNGYQSKPYPISIIERNWFHCASAGDPHIDTYFGHHYEIFDVGKYILTSIPSRKIEVQVTHTQCGSVSCNCGVIAREGNNILGIDNCPSQSQSSATFIRYQKDLNNPGGYIYSDVGQSYVKTIVLPSGMIITVSLSQSPGYIALDVYMYGLDTDTSGGICSSSFNNINGYCGSQCDQYRVQGTNFWSIGNSGTQTFCDNDAILVPQCDCTNSGTAGSSCPMSNNGIPIFEYSNTCSQPPSSRRKRADSSNAITTTQMPSGKVQPPTLVWPTANKQITLQQATDACNNALTKSAVFNLCIIQLHVNVSTIIQSCVLDIQIMEDLVFPTSYVASSMEIQCKVLIDSTNNSTLKGNYQQQYTYQICPNQCSGQGQCVNGNCVCNTQYQSSDCSVQSGAIPNVVGLPSDTCDIRANTTYGCSVVFLWAKDATNSLRCKVTNASTEKLTVMSIDESPVVNLGFVLCHLPDLPVRLGVAQSACNFSISVSLSNDGTNYGNSSSFRVTDSQCNSTITCPAGSTKCGASKASKTVATVILPVLIFLFRELMR